MLPPRVIATDSALDLIKDMQCANGEIIFYQSGGCCDGSVPYCYQKDDFKIGENDILLGLIGGVKFYIHKAQFEYWKHTQLIIDAQTGNGSEFSLEYGSGKRFVLVSRIFSNDEIERLESGAKKAY